MIICLSGLIGSGKNTVAEYLAGQGFQQLSFASALKDSVAATFGWNRQALEGITPAARRWRDTVDTWWSNKLKMPGLTPRYALQYIGTNVFRRHFNENIWILNVERAIDKAIEKNQNVVVTDLRFPNEYVAMKALGANCLLISPAVKPEWYATAYRYVTCLEYDRYWLDKQGKSSTPK